MRKIEITKYERFGSLDSFRPFLTTYGIYINNQFLGEIEEDELKEIGRIITEMFK